MRKGLLMKELNLPGNAITNFLERIFKAERYNKYKYVSHHLI